MKEELKLSRSDLATRVIESLGYVTQQSESVQQTDQRCIHIKMKTTDVCITCTCGLLLASLFGALQLSEPPAGRLFDRRTYGKVKVTCLLCVPLPSSRTSRCQGPQGWGARNYPATRKRAKKGRRENRSALACVVDVLLRAHHAADFVVHLF